MENPPDLARLRPIERRVLHMRSNGVSVDEIANRLKRSPQYVERLIVWTGIPREGKAKVGHLRPLERRVLYLRASGESHERIGERFKRSGRFIRQVEGLALYKKSMRLLTQDPEGLG